jgi:hypothetical protein
MMRNSVTRMEQGVRTRRSADTTSPAEVTPQSDADLLAREAARVFAEQLAWFKKTKDDLFDPNLAPTEHYLARITAGPPEDFSFDDFEQLTKTDPARALKRWDEVKAAARRELDSGWRAARTIEGMDPNAWQRALFLAVRDRLRETWQPRTDAEALLVDEIAQYEMIREQWVKSLAHMSREQEAIYDLKHRRDDLKDRDIKRNISALEATREATNMVERVQRLQQNAIRTLLSLRRTKATFTVRNTGSVNVALGPQLNVAGPPADESAPRVVVPTEALN